MVLPTLAALLLEAGLLAWLRRDYRGVPAFVAACTLTLSGIATAYHTQSQSFSRLKQTLCGGAAGDGRVFHFLLSRLVGVAAPGSHWTYVLWRACHA